MRFLVVQISFEDDMLLFIPQQKLIKLEKLKPRAQDETIDCQCSILKATIVF